MSKTRVRSGVAKAPKFIRWQSPQHCTMSPAFGVPLRSYACTFAVPRKKREGRFGHAGEPNGKAVSPPGPCTILRAEPADRAGVGRGSRWRGWSAHRFFGRAFSLELARFALPRARRPAEPSLPSGARPLGSFERWFRRLHGTTPWCEAMAVCWPGPLKEEGGWSGCSIPALHQRTGFFLSTAEEETRPAK